MFRRRGHDYQVRLTYVCIFYFKNNDFNKNGTERLPTFARIYFFVVHVIQVTCADYAYLVRNDAERFSFFSFAKP